MKYRKLKTKGWPEGRPWPDEIVLEVGSNMPMDVHGMPDDYAGVRYVRHDPAAQITDGNDTKGSNLDECEQAA